MEQFSEKLKKILLKFLMLDTPKFSKIILKKEVAENICEFAKQLHPKEFVAIIEGKVKDEQLRITDLYYQEFVSSYHSASFSNFLPSVASGIGTVHSHPSSNTKPSNADLFFFSKKGLIHFIIGFPYTEENIVCYDFNGNELVFSINS